MCAACLCVRALHLHVFCTESRSLQAWHVPGVIHRTKCRSCARCDPLHQVQIVCQVWSTAPGADRVPGV